MPVPEYSLSSMLGFSFLYSGNDTQRPCHVKIKVKSLLLYFIILFTSSLFSISIGYLIRLLKPWLFSLSPLTSFQGPSNIGPFNSLQSLRPFP